MEENKPECACEIHLRANPDKPCLGHGENCPCSRLLIIEKASIAIQEEQKKKEGVDN